MNLQAITRLALVVVGWVPSHKGKTIQTTLHIKVICEDRAVNVVQVLYT